MYPVRLGHDTAVRRIGQLVDNEHHAEALVTSIFTVEKVLRRTLKELIVSAGFTSKAANQLMRSFNGFQKIKDVWWCFDPEGKGLPEIIGAEHWAQIPPSATMRNKLVHGERAYPLADCEAQTVHILASLKHIENVFQERYGYSGWKNNSVRRVSKLHADAKVGKSKT